MPRYARFTMSGTLASGQERWSTSVAFTDEDQIAPYESGTAQAWATAGAAWINTNLGTTLRNALSSGGSITRINTYLYSDVGGVAQYAGITNTSIAGLTSPVHPLQTAVVCSLRTPLATRSGRGRMYWPAVGTPVQSNGRVINTTVGSMVAEFRLLLQGIASTWPETGEIEPVVVSESTSALNKVSSLQVGDVLDTQRRRRDSLPEAYTSVTY